MIFRSKGHSLARGRVRLLLFALAAPIGCEVSRRPEPPHAVTDRRSASPSPVARPVVGPEPEPSKPRFGSDAAGEPAQASGTDAFDPAASPKVRLAVIGDYGRAGPAEQQVAELVHSLQVHFVVTTGDNNYPSGAAATIDENIGQYFSELIHPYRGNYGSSATENRFFPVLGNHDWYTPGAAPYLEYFTLPGNERYYDVVRGDVHFFAIDSDPHEPDGTTATSIQAMWLKQQLQASTAAFKIVSMHHPPYSSGPHGNTPHMQWPYEEWGADLVLAGHDHGYERLQIGGLTYVVSGLGGASIYSFGSPVPGSVVRYNAQYGATVLDVTREELVLSFLDVDKRLADTARISAR